MFKKLLISTILTLGSVSAANAIEASNTTCNSSTGEVTTVLKATHFDAWYFKTMYAVAKSGDGSWKESSKKDVTISQSVDFTFNVKNGYNYSHAAVYVIDRNGHQSYLDTVSCN